MADLVGEDDIANLMKAFARFDLDNDGLIGTSELRQVLHFMGQNPTDAELQDLAYAMDTDESGKIDLPEFLHMMAKTIADSNIEEDILEAFKVFDKVITNGRILHIARMCDLVFEHSGRAYFNLIFFLIKKIRARIFYNYLTTF
jgi:Ca2+-binding EF-hand superfamily protein